MSDASQGPGWWLASDGRWYPPSSAPGAPPPPPPPPQAAEPAELLEVRGVNGTVQFDGLAVTIKRTGFLARTTVGKGEKRIPLKSITAVQWKEPGMVRGYIQFTLAGGNELRSRPGRQTTDAAKDENSVLIDKKHAAGFRLLKEVVEAGIDQL